MKQLTLESLDELNWEKAHVSKSLSVFYRQAINHAELSVQWYAKLKFLVALGAGVLRLGALLSVSIGALGPLLSSVFSLNWRLFTTPLAATLFAALAATFIGIDRALGLSSRHMRFIAAISAIQKQLVGFRLKWHAKMATLGGCLPAPDDVHSLLQMAIEFDESVWNIIQDETAKYQVDYEVSLSALQTQANELKAEMKEASHLPT